MVEQRTPLGIPPHLHGRVWSMSGQPGARRPRHAHDELELNLVTGGHARYLVDNRRYDLSPGTLIWLYPDQFHVLVDESSDYRMWIAVFAPAMITSLCHAPDNLELTQSSPTLPMCCTLPRHSVNELDQLMAQLADADADRLNAGLGFLLLQAWHRFNQATHMSGSAGLHPAVQNAVRHLREHPRPGRIDQLALICGLSPSRLSLLFKKETGLSITQFRQQCALDRFIEQYSAKPRAGMMAVAIEAGFGSYAQFHRVFRHHTGFGPAEFRRRLRIAGGR